MKCSFFFSVESILLFWPANEEKQFNFKLKEEGVWKGQQNEKVKLKGERLLYSSFLQATNELWSKIRFSLYVLPHLSEVHIKMQNKQTKTSITNTARLYFVFSFSKTFLLEAKIKHFPSFGSEVVGNYLKFK